MSKNTILWALLACLLWSTSFVGVKIGLEHASPLYFAGLRFMLSGLMILPFCKQLPTMLAQVKDNWKDLLVLSFYQTSLLYAIFFWGMTIVPAAIAAVIVGASPLTTSVVTHFLTKNDRLSLRKVLILGLGFLGVLLISVGRYGIGETSTGELWGMLLLLTGAVSSALGNLKVSSGTIKMHPFNTTAVQIFLGGLSLFAISFVVEDGQGLTFPEEFWWSLGWLAFISAAAFSIWFMLLSREGVLVSDLNLWKFLIPLAGVALSWIMLPDESPNWLTFVGMIIVASAVVFFFGFGKKRAATESKN